MSERNQWHPPSSAPGNTWVLIQLSGEELPVIAKKMHRPDKRREWWVSDIRFAVADYEAPSCNMDRSYGNDAVQCWMPLPKLSTEFNQKMWDAKNES